jgi:hypothetical protein
LAKYNLPSNHKNSAEIVPLAKGSVTKANIKGKYVRQQPENKITKTVEIKYKKKDGTKVEYKRDFHVYAKELLHQYQIPITFRENIHGQQVVVSPLLAFDNTQSSNMKNTHIINMFCEICNDYEVFTDNLEPAIKFNKRFEDELLPQGKLSEAINFENVANIAHRTIRNEQKAKAFIERLKVIQEFNPDIRGKGPQGFFGYIVLGFSDKKIVVLER